MSSYVISHGFAHRMTVRGIMESTPVTQEGDQIQVDEDGWTQRIPDIMDLTGSDYEHIRNQLEINTQMFPEGRVRIYRQPTKPVKHEEVERIL